MLLDTLKGVRFPFIYDNATLKCQHAANEKENSLTVCVYTPKGSKYILLLVFRNIDELLISMKVLSIKL